jgi:large subunit ribosomal protein L1
MFKKFQIVGFGLLNLHKRSFASQFSKLVMKHRQLEREKTKQAAQEGVKVAAVAKDTVKRGSKNYIYPSPVDALNDIQEVPITSELECVSLVVALNVDVKRGDQNIRGIFKMPGGSHKIPKIAVFTSPQYQQIAKDAGADILGNEDTVKDITDGKIDFEKCISTTEMLPLLKNVGRILGPMGLMPSTKLGTACPPEKLVDIIKDLKTGSREFKLDIYGQINVPLGKRSFPDENILRNLDSFMKVLNDKKPDGVKGRFFLYAYLVGKKKSYRVDMKSLDPKSSSYFMNKLNI